MDWGHLPAPPPAGGAREGHTPWRMSPHHSLLKSLIPGPPTDFLLGWLPAPPHPQLSFLLGDFKDSCSLGRWWGSMEMTWKGLSCRAPPSCECWAGSELFSCVYNSHQEHPGSRGQPRPAREQPSSEVNGAISGFSQRAGSCVTTGAHDTLCQ